MGGQCEQPNVTATESTASLSVESIRQAVSKLKEDSLPGTIGMFYGVSVVAMMNGYIGVYGGSMATGDSEFNERQAEVSKEFMAACQRYS